MKLLTDVKITKKMDTNVKANVMINHKTVQRILKALLDHLRQKKQSVQKDIFAAKGESNRRVEYLVT